MYYGIDNGDVYQIVDENGLKDVIAGEASSYNEETNKADEPIWTVRLEWMTQEEFENLPDAY